MKKNKIKIISVAVFFACIVFVISVLLVKGESLNLKPESKKEAEKKTGLSTRQKLIIPIAAHTAAGNIPMLEKSLSHGMDTGLSVNEVKEILVQSYAYAGFPRALNAINAYMRIMKARNDAGIKDNQGRDSSPMPPSFDKKAFGNKTRNYLVGKDISNSKSGYPVFTPIIDKFLVEHLFADIFYRDVLSFQDRELVTISMLAAMSGTEDQLKTHLYIAQRMGLGRQQLEEFVLELKQNVSPESSLRAGVLIGISSEDDNKRNVSTDSLTVSRADTPVSAPADHFKGKVTVSSFFRSEYSGNYGGAIVNFEKGGRTAWHTHPRGQTLIVMSGQGLVQTEGEPAKKIYPGDIVWIPADKRHWHGASIASPMSHLAIAEPENGSTVEWMEQVSDEQYSSQN